MCRRIVIIFLAAILISPFLTGCKPRGVIVVSNQRSQPQSMEILRRYTGSDPGLKEPMVLLVNDLQELKSLGSHDLVVQAIDFDTESLLLLSLGEKPTGGYWARINRVQQDGDFLFVQGLANRPASDQAVAQVLTYPYDAVVIKKRRHAAVHSEIESVVGEFPQAHHGK